MSKNISKPAVLIFLNAKTKEVVKLAANLYTLKPSLTHLGLSVDIVRNDLSNRKRIKITPDEPYLILPNVQVIHLL